MKQNKYLVTGDDISTMGLTLLPGKEELSGKKILTCGEILDTYQVEIAGITDSKRCVPYERIAASVYLNLSASTLDFTAAGGTKTITIDTNIAEDSLSLNTISGFTVTRVGKSITIVADNLGTTPTNKKSSELIVSGSGLTTSCIISQSENIIASLKITSSGGDPDTEFPTSFSAGGATYTAASYAYYSSGSHKELTDTSIDNWSISGDGFSIEANVNFPYCVNVTASNRYDVDGAEREAILSISYSDKTSSLKLLQEANLINYGEVTLSGGLVPDIPAWGGQVDAATELVGDQTISYTSGSVRPGNVTIQYSDPVWAPSLGTDEHNRRQVGILTATGLGEGEKKAIKEFLIYQEKNVPEDIQYDMPYITSFTVDDIPASGGTISNGKVQYYQNRRQFYTSKEPKELSPITSGAELSYSDPVSADSLHKDPKNRSKVGELTVYVTLNEERGEKTVNVYQEANEETISKELVLVLANTPGISVDNPLPASGGKIQYNAYCKIVSSYTSGDGDESRIQTPISIYGDGFTADLNEGDSDKFVTAENRGANYGDSRRATLSTVFEEFPEKSVYIYQEANDELFGEVTFTTEGIVGDIPASGGTIDAVTDLDAAQIITYSSGFSRPGTISITYSNPVSAGPLGTIEIGRTKVGEITATASGEGDKQAVKVYPIYQEPNIVDDIIYDTPNITSFIVEDIPAAGGTISSGEVIYSQNWRKHFTSEKFKEMPPITSGGKISYSDPVSALSLQTTTKERSKVGEFTVYVELNNERGDKIADVFQQENKVESFGNISISSFSYPPMNALEGEYNPTIGPISQEQIYTSNSIGYIEIASRLVTYSLIDGNSFANINSNSGIISLTENTTTSTRSLTARATVSSNSITVTKDYSCTQEAGVKTYSDVEATLTYSIIPAKGGTVQPNLSYSQTWGWNGKTTGGGVITSGGEISYSGAGSDGSVSAVSKGTTVSEQTIVATPSVTVKLNGKSGGGSAVVYQQANNVDSYGDISIAAFSYANVVAGGGKSNPIVGNITQQTIYTSGATSIINLQNPSKSYSIPSAVSGASVAGDTGIVTWSNNQSTSTRSVTIRLTVTANGKTATKDATCAQNAGAKSYSDVTVNLSYPIIPAKGGSVSPTLSYSQTWGWNGSVTGGGTITDGGEITWSNGADPESGAVSALSKGTDVGPQTTVVTPSVSVKLNGKSGGASATVYQAANSVTYGEVVISGGSVADIPAKGGSVTSASGISASQKITYTSEASRTATPSITYTQTVTANSLLDVPSDRSKVGTLIAKATGEGSKTATKSFDVYQEANKESFGEVIFADGGTVSDIPASGGTIDSVTELTASQTVSYTSGASRPVDAIISYSTPVSAKSKGNSISNRTSVGTLTATATGEGGKIATKQFTVYQVGNYVTKIELSGGSLSYPTIEAGATSATPTAKGMDLMYTFTSGTKSSPTPASTFGTYSASASYSLGSVINGFTAVNSSSGVLTATNRGTIVGNARTSGIVTRTVKTTWTPTAEYNAGGTITGTGKLTATCTQKANIIESVHIAACGGNYSIPLDTTFIAAGSNRCASSYGLFSSGSYQEMTSGDISNWSIKGEGFSIDKNENYPYVVTINAENRYDVPGPERTAVLTYTYEDKSDSCQLLQEENTIKTYGEVSITGGTVYDIPASGGTVDAITELEANQTILYTSNYSRPGEVTISYSDPITAPSLGTTLKSRSKVGTLTAIATGEGGKKAIKDFEIYQQENIRTPQGTSGGETTWGDVVSGAIQNGTIPASGGFASAKASTGTQTYVTSATLTKYYYTSGATKDEVTIPEVSGSEVIQPDKATISASASSKGTTVSELTIVKQETITWIGVDNKKASNTAYIYQQANKQTGTTLSVPDFQNQVILEWNADMVNMAQYFGSVCKSITYTSGSSIDTPIGNVESGTAQVSVEVVSKDPSMTISPSSYMLIISDNNTGNQVTAVLRYTFSVSSSGLSPISKDMTIFQKANTAPLLGSLLLKTATGSFPASTFYIQFQIQGTDLATTLGTVDMASGTISIPQNIVESVVNQAYGAPANVDIKLHQGTTPSSTPTMTGLLTQQQINELKLGKGITIIVG